MDDGTDAITAALQSVLDAVFSPATMSGDVMATKNSDGCTVTLSDGATVTFGADEIVFESELH